MMWFAAFLLLLRLGLYFWDIGVDILVGREQIEKTFPDYKFKGKSKYDEIKTDGLHKDAWAVSK